MEQQTTTSNHTDIQNKAHHTDDLTTQASKLSEYIIEETLGKGSQGVVFRARRKSDNKIVAIKKLNIHSIQNWKMYDLFKREAEVLSSLDIEGVAHFYDAFECLTEDHPCAYIVEEYIPAKSLTYYYKNNRHFQKKEIYTIIIQLLHVLKKLHSHNPPVIHRDINPSNILIDINKTDINGETKPITYLIDFGAVANPQVQNGGSTVAGTYGYMPPEQLMGRPVPESDIYALGAVLIFLFTGKSPASLPTKDFRIVFETEMDCFNDASLIQIIQKMTDPDVSNRPSIDTLISAFNELLNSGQIKDALDNIPITEFNLEKKLQNIRFLGEESSFTLWQQLPTKTPRDVPKIYKNLNKSSLFNDLNPFSPSYMQRLAEYKNDVAPFIPDVKAWIQGSLFFSFILLTVFACIYPPVICFFAQFFSMHCDYNLSKGSFWEIGSLRFEVGGMCLITFLITLCICVLVLLIRFVRKNKLISRQLNKMNYMQSYNLFCHNFSILLKNGSKKMAKVTEIKYLPSTFKTIEKPLSKKQENTDSRAAFYGNIPRFQITYTFEHNQTSFQSTIECTHNPNDYLKIDDPLPILYYDGLSIPYPIPINENFFFFPELIKKRCSDNTHV